MMGNWQKKEPCWPERRAGFSKNRGSMSDLELPAYLLGETLNVSTRAVTTEVPTHTQTARPEGRFRGVGNGFEEEHWLRRCVLSMCARLRRVKYISQIFRITSDLLGKIEYLLNPYKV